MSFVAGGLESWISSDDFPASTRVEDWQFLLEKLGFGGKLIPDSRHKFSAGMSIVPFGHSQVIALSGEPAILRRTKKDIDARNSNKYVLIRMESGHALFEQYGKQLNLSPGDCCLVNSGAPFCATYSCHRATALIMDTEAVRRWRPNLESGCAMVLSPSRPWGRALSAAMSALASSAREMTMPSNLVVDQILCLLSLAIEMPPAAGTYRTSLFCRLRQMIHEHVADHDFDPTKCAELCGLSLRTLHMIFASHGTSFGQVQKEIRLHLARRYLDDGRFDKKTMAEIATLCGFSNSSHFITCFGKLFGVSPKKYRMNRSSSFEGKW